MMPGERAALERLALELEILNRRTELREFKKKPLEPDFGFSPPAVLEYAKNEKLRELERALAQAISRRAKW